VTSTIGSTATRQAYTPNLPGVPLVNITAVPQQVPIAPNGSTLINTSPINITLSTDSIPNPANSFQLAGNGASLPMPVGPLWASTPQTFLGLANLLVIPGMFNIFNPNVLSEVAPTAVLFDAVLALPSTAIPPLNWGAAASLTEFPGGVIPILPQTHTLLISCNAIIPATAILTVTGAQSNYPYYNNPFYLQGGFTGLAVVPVNPGIDQGVVVTLAAFKAGPPPALATCQVVGDSNEYEESIFYNGEMQAKSTSIANGTRTLITGPARLLTVAVGSQGTAGQVNMGIAPGDTFLFSGGLTNTPGPLTLPDNTILPVGTNLTITSFAAATTAVGTCSFAYP
jgi:hypothetical protein